MISSPAIFSIRFSDGSKTPAKFFLLTGLLFCISAPAQTPHSASVTWAESTSPGVMGYNVYRQTANGGPFTRINASLVANTGYVDYSVQAGNVYYYVVTSVDAANHESGPSNQATAFVVVPFGSFDTPANKSTGLSGNIAVTGWALDSIQIAKVDLWREPVAGEPVPPNGLVYIGDAVFSTGTRPDIQVAYPNFPFSNRAGWSYTLSTTGLPGNGNGTFKLHAIAHDTSGFSTDLGTHTITVANAVPGGPPISSGTAPIQSGTTPIQSGGPPIQ